MILLVDNYDSFSYNLFQLVGSFQKEIRVIRNDEWTVEEIEQAKPECIILSPGPGRPMDAGICEELVKKLKGRIPILGVCLGHQGICEALGAEITYAKKLMHGKQSICEIDSESPLFHGLGQKLKAARYHSLAVKEETLPEELKIIARAPDGEIMAVSSEKNRLYGLQFHPESILTPEGKTILGNFLRLCEKL